MNNTTMADSFFSEGSDIKDSDIFLDTFFIKTPLALAGHLSVAEAMIISKIYYWVKKFEKGYKEEGKHQDHIHNGNMWIFNTYEEWQEQIPFYSVKTIVRNIAKLRKKGLILVSRFNKLRKDRTRWYTINDVGFEALTNKISGKTIIPGQNVPLDKDKMTPPLPIDYIHKNNDINRLVVTNPSPASFPKTSGQASESEPELLGGESSATTTDTEGDLKGREIFNFYTECYQEQMKTPHPFIKQRQIDHGVSVIAEFIEKHQLVTNWDLPDMILRDLQRTKRLGNTDGNFIAFANPKVLEMLRYEVKT